MRGQTAIRQFCLQHTCSLSLPSNVHSLARSFLDEALMSGGGSVVIAALSLSSSNESLHVDWTEEWPLLLGLLLGPVIFEVLPRVLCFYAVIIISFLLI